MIYWPINFFIYLCVDEFAVSTTHNSDTETYNKYKIEDLPKFFKKRSKNISKAFSNETIKISTIRSRSIESNIQKFSFELTATDKDTFNIRLFRINPLIDFFKICLPQEKILQSTWKCRKKAVNYIITTVKLTVIKLQKNS